LPLPIPVVVDLLAQTGRSWVEEGADVAGIVVGVAAVVSLLVAARSVREIQKDRALRVRPRLLFDVGAEAIPYTVDSLKGIPGINPTYAQAVLAAEPALTRRAKPSHSWGKLSNYGNGSALAVSIIFLTLRARVGGESFALDASKLATFPYEPALNTIPASPSNLHPGGSADFLRIPTPILAGLDRNRSQISGVVAIAYTDVFDRPFLTYQEFQVSVYPAGEDHGEMIMTFGDELTRTKAAAALEPVESAIPQELRPSTPGTDV
jgi:hypothetical protein